MKNLKIKCKTIEQGKQAQELFFSLGYGFEGCKNKNIQVFEYVSDFYLYAYSDGDLTHSCAYGTFMNKAHKEITLQELRDMVNPVKEYLDPSNNYSLIKAHRKEGNDWIEVPEGANVYARCNIFGDYKWLPKITNGDWSVLWQRHTQPEELPFVDSLPEFKHDFGASSLNDQYAEIEQVRQSAIKVESGGDSDHMADAMSYGYMGISAPKKHHHYFKDVSNIAEIDVYTVLKLFDVTDPCLQHIVKKALCAGKRGHKDMMEDLQNIVDTAIRAVELNS